MATYYGVNATRTQVTVPPVKIPPYDAGKLYCLYDQYTLTADLVGGTDIIYMMTIPAGARVMGCEVAFADLDGSGGTIDVGWNASADAVETVDLDGFIADADVTSADTIGMGINLANGAGQFKLFSSPVQVVVTLDGDTDATTGTIKLAVWFIVS